jgi:hypothetical protein
VVLVSHGIVGELWAAVEDNSLSIVLTTGLFGVCVEVKNWSRVSTTMSHNKDMSTRKTDVARERERERERKLLYK